MRLCATLETDFPAFACHVSHTITLVLPFLTFNLDTPIPPSLILGTSTTFPVWGSRVSRSLTLDVGTPVPPPLSLPPPLQHYHPPVSPCPQNELSFLSPLMPTTCLGSHSLCAQRTVFGLRG